MRPVWPREARRGPVIDEVEMTGSIAVQARGGWKIAATPGAGCGSSSELWRRGVPRSGTISAGQRLAQGSTNFVTETDGAVGTGTFSEHEGPEQGRGRLGAGIGDCPASSLSARSTSMNRSWPDRFVT